MASPNITIRSERTRRRFAKEKNIALIDDVEYDYKRRQGNLVLRAALNIKPEIFERKPRKKYRANDNSLKRSLAISEKIVGKMVGNFLTSFAENCEMNAANGMGRLREIEEIEKNREREQAASTATAPARSSRYKTKKLIERGRDSIILEQKRRRSKTGSA